MVSGDWVRGLAKERYLRYCSQCTRNSAIRGSLQIRVSISSRYLFCRHWCKMIRTSKRPKTIGENSNFLTEMPSVHKQQKIARHPHFYTF